MRLPGVASDILGAVKPYASRSIARTCSNERVAFVGQRLNCVSHLPQQTSPAITGRRLTEASRLGDQVESAHDGPHEQKVAKTLIDFEAYITFPVGKTAWNTSRASL